MRAPSLAFVALLLSVLSACKTAPSENRPSLGLAPQAAHQIFETIRRLSSELGVTILMVEQNVRMGLALADHAFVLDLGTKRFEGPSKEIADDPRIRDLYLGAMAPNNADTEDSDV